jgi:hypothetical protein
VRTLILITAALLAASASTAAAAPCNQGQLVGKWQLSSSHGNSCAITIATNGTFKGRCVGPFWPPRGGPFKGTLKVRKNCVISGQNRGTALGGRFGPLEVGPAALAQDGNTVTGVTETGDGDQKHMFTMTKLP